MKRILSISLAFTVALIGSVSTFELLATQRATAANNTPLKRRNIDTPPDPAAVQQDVPIVISDPPADRAVGVNQVRMEITLNDPDINDLMVTVYTEASGSTPATARLVEVRRSDRDKKAITIALTKGINRIQVNDVKRTDLRAFRTITYVPDPDVLGLSTTRTIAPTKGQICGQLQLASLNQTLALIKATPELGDLAARFRDRDDALVNSRLNDTCGANDQADGTQKFAVIDVLKAVLLRLEPDLSPDEDLELNKLARRQTLTSLLRGTSAPVRVRSTAAPSDAGSASSDPTATAKRAEQEQANPEAEAKRKALEDAAEKDALKLSDTRFKKLSTMRGTEFSSLSANTIRKQIVMLEQYLGNVTVQLKRDGQVIDRVRTDRDGNFLFTLAADEGGNGATARTGGTGGGGSSGDGSGAGGSGAGGSSGGGSDASGGAGSASDSGSDTGAGSEEYTISTEGDEYYTVRMVNASPDGPSQRVNLVIEDKPVSLLARAIVGYEQAGAAAAANDQTYFFDLFLSKSFPFRQKINPDFGESLRLWGDFRIASIPQSGDATLGDFTAGFATQVSQLKVKDIARVFEFVGGLEYRLTGNNALLSSFDRRTRQKFSLSLIGGFGAVTPLDSRSGITTFRVFDDAPGLPPAARGKEFIAFARTDRDRFFRQYYAGLRVNTFFFNNFNVPMQRFPAQFDVTIGQNEFVTGGKLHGPVFRMEGFFPLPYEDLKYINLFVTALMRPGGSKTSTPLILLPAPDGTVVPAANVVLFAVPQSSRDYYRIGAGIDFVSFYQWLRQSRSNR